jgi:hypothetical protein
VLQRELGLGFQADAIATPRSSPRARQQRKGRHNVVGGDAAHGRHFGHDFRHGDIAVRHPHGHLWQGMCIQSRLTSIQ